MDAPTRKERIERFFENLKKHGITKIFERQSLEAAKSSIF